MYISLKDSCAKGFRKWGRRSSTVYHKYGIRRVQSDGKSDDKVMPAGKGTE